MKRILHFLVGSALVAFSVVAQGQIIMEVDPATVATVNWESLTDPVATADGTALPAGDLLRIGTFNLTDAQIAAAQSNFALLNASFTEYDTAMIGDGVGGTAGFWTKSSSKSTGDLSGERIYIWAFNAPSAGTATQQGIFTHSDMDPTLDWVFPSDTAIPNTKNIDLSQVQPSEVVVGGFGNGVYNLAPIPEPSSTAMVMAGMSLIGIAAQRLSWRPKR